MGIISKSSGGTNRRARYPTYPLAVFQSSFQHSSTLKRPRCLKPSQLACRAVKLLPIAPAPRKAGLSRRCQMTSIADRIAGPPLAGARSDRARGRAGGGRLSLPAISVSAGGERELRLDLFRGLALWLIFIDHLPPNLLTWFTIRNYGFSDATEIFIFISGYTAAFVYGRAMLRVRLRGRDRAHPAAGLADLRRACVPVHDLSRGDFLRRHQFREPAVLAKKWASWIFSSSRTSPSSRRCC